MVGIAVVGLNVVGVLVVGLSVDGSAEGATSMSQESEPAEEDLPTGQLKHCDAPMNMVCVDVNRVFTSAAESTLLYMRKSLSPPFKYRILIGFFQDNYLICVRIWDTASMFQKPRERR